MSLELVLGATEVSESAHEAGVALRIDEARFRAFYTRTARPLWGYLCRVSGDPALADDLLQETYYRFLRSGAWAKEEPHRRHYLFRIATNLLRDHFRKAKSLRISLARILTGEGAADPAERMDLRSDVGHALQELKPRDRSLLWLAYVEGYTHREVAEVMGFKEQSIRPLLFRARRRLADLLRQRGMAAEGGERVRR